MADASAGLGRPANSSQSLATEPTRADSGKLLQRVLTAAWILPLLLGTLFLAPLSATLVAVAAAILVSAWEWAAFLGWTSTSRRCVYVALMAAAMAAADFWVPDSGRGVFLGLALVWWLIAFLWILRFPLGIGRVATGIAGVAVLVPVWVGIATLLRTDSAGPGFVLLVLAIVWGADIGGYFCGRRFGRIKLAPNVSPGKTWEGAIGGMLLAAVAAAVGATLVELPLDAFVPIGLAVAAISIVGDLTESMFKRNAGLKDSGHIFPGHGGMLDRLDSIAAAVPVYCLGLYWLGVLR